MLVTWALTLTIQAGSRAKPTPKAADSSRARKFVQGFYDWYAPRCLRNVFDQRSMQIVRSKKLLFESHLWRALTADDRAQQRVTGEIVGLDFDPFEGGQDPETSYRVGAVTLRSGRYWAEVYGAMSEKMTHKPCVVAIVSRRKGTWMFENFYYPADPGSPGTDLRTTLKELAHDRARHPHK